MAFEKWFSGYAYRQAKNIDPKITMFPLGLAKFSSLNVLNAKDNAEFAIDFIQILGETERLDGDIISVPSPWHAAFLLVIFTGLAINSDWVPHVFRGQGNSEWDLIPKIFREGEETNNSKRALKIFSKTLFYSIPTQPIDASNFLREISIEEVSVIALAQHYGVPTELLDFTTDPFIAIWFADHSTNSGKSASVYALPWNKANGLGMKVIIPPPIGERIFHQQGVFIKTINYKNIKRNCIEIRFPPTNSFEIYDKKGEKWSAYTSRSADKWLEDVKNKAYEWAKRGIEHPLNYQQDMTKMLDDFFKNMGQSPINSLKTTSPDDILGDWVFKHLSLFVWLGYYIKNGNVRLDKKIIKSIVEVNPNWASAAVYILYYLSPRHFNLLRFEPEWGEECKKIAKVFNEYLPNNMGWDLSNPRQ